MYTYMYIYEDINVYAYIYRGGGERQRERKTCSSMASADETARHAPTRVSTWFRKNAPHSWSVRRG